MVKPILFCLLFCSVMLIGVSSAQDELEEVFINDAQTFEVLYNADWEVLQSDDLGVSFGHVTDDTIVFFIDPAELGLQLDGIEDVLEASEVYREFITTLSEAKVIDGIERQIARGTVEDDELPFSLYFIVQFDDGGYGLALLAGDIEDLVDAEALVLTYNNVGASDLTADLNLDESKNYPNELDNHDGPWQDAIEELQDEGVIGIGGSLVFNENYAFFSGQGNFFTPLARNSSYTNIIMAGELTFEAGSTTALEQCVLTSRIVTDNRGSATEFLDVGLTNNGNLVIIDIFDGDDSPIVDFRQLSADLDETIHIMYLAIDDQITVYVDGELFIEDSEITERSGSFGIALIGEGPGARCEGNNIWVYQVPTFEEGVCEISTGSNVNKRSGPGTNFDRAGQLAAGQVVEAIAQGSDGSFTWWQLDDESWVREDVVNEAGDCVNLPTKQ